MEQKSRFLIRNFIKGLLWVVVILIIFVYAEDFIQAQFQEHFGIVHRTPTILFVIFFISEILFGLVPPEFFMLLWILGKVSLVGYVHNLIAFSVLSYLAGIIGYFIGKNFSKADFFIKIQSRYLDRYSKIKEYGGFLLLVGAITPVPFSATCMLAGTVNYPYKRFLLICIFRVVRFALYGWMVWSFPGMFST